MNAIIFGINGQDGYYLKQLLISQNIEVIGVSRNNADFIGNVADLSFVESLISKFKPEYVFHLAANSTTRYDVLFENHETISTGTINILDSVKKISPSTKVFLSGSALQFENLGHPISEDDPFEGSSPYSVSRIHSVFMGRYYREKFGLKVYVGYFFNHDSALRSEHHINQKIVQTAKRIAAGSNERLTIGSLEAKKEFNFSGDIVAAIWKLVNQEIVFEVVIGCGVAYRIKDWIKCCFEKVLLNWEHHVDIDLNYTPEYDILVSNPKRILELGWKPEVDFTGLCNIMMKEIL